MARKILIQKTKELFREIKHSPGYIYLVRRSVFLRVVLGVVFVIYGFVGIFSPIPLGLPVLCVGLSLFVGIARVKRWVIRCIYFFRIHILFAKVYIWWKSR